MVYNAGGQRTRANLNGDVFRYVYNGDRALNLTDDSGDVLTTYLVAGPTFLDSFLVSGPAESAQLPLYDAVGTARGLVDTSGTVTDTYDFDALGRYLGGSGSTPGLYRYGGAYGYITDTVDSTHGSGLLQLGARYYWPEVGRFVQQDPIGDGMNWYAYAGGNPVVAVDPGGDSILDIAFVAADVATAIGCPSWQNLGWAAVAVATTALPVPDVVDYVRYGARAAEELEHGAETGAFLFRLVRHHGTPRAVIAELEGISPEVAKAVRGVRGMPNRVAVPEWQHIFAHGGGANGGRYNAAFKAAIANAGGYADITAEEIWAIRSDLLRKFFGIIG